MKSKILKEFKEFAMRGNVIDLAVGIIIGGAFGKIISSLVADIIMPLVGIIVGGVNFTELKIILKHGSVNAAGQPVPEIAITIGNFIQATFDFVIIAFAIFMLIKLINRLKTKREEAAAPATDVQLLTEIRDLLKKDMNK